MIKKYLKSLGLILILVTNSAFGFNPAKQPFLTLNSPGAKVNITTAKVARIYGAVRDKSYIMFKKDMDATASLPGDRVILINSPGGEVDVGNMMIDEIKKEQKAGVKVICFAFNNAHSMAFNILTTCNVRLMGPDTMALVHKIARAMIPERMTAHNLRIIADDLDKSDEPFRRANAAAMHLTVQQYDTYADLETYWRAETLLKMGYLHGLGFIEK